MLEKTANTLARSPWIRHIYFFFCALISIILVGYYLGTFDQAVHIPFLRAAVDETLYPNDAFIALRHTHYSFFWIFFRPLLRAGILEPAMFGLHLLATYLTFWMFWRLSRTLFQDALAAMLATLVFVPPHVLFAGFPIIEFSLLNRTFVLPFILFALDLYLRGRYAAAFLLLGLLYNLHIVSVNFAMAMVVFASAIEIRKMGWQNLALGLLLFILGASPVLAWKANGAPLDLSVRWDWFNTLSDGMLHHLFHLIGPAPYTLVFAVINFSGLALFFIAWRALQPAPPHTAFWRQIGQDLVRYWRAEDPSPQRTAVLFFWALLLVVVVEQLSALFFPITILVQLQILRAGVMAVVLAYLYFARLLAETYRHQGARDRRWISLAFAYLFGIFPIWPVTAWAVRRWAANRPQRQIWLGAGTTASLVATVAISLIFGIWKPGLYIYGPQNAWQDAQEWARKHTPKSAVFITPPEIWWMYESDWRVFSERSTVSTLNELLEGAFDPGYTHIWMERFDAVAPGARAQFSGDFPNNILITQRAYYAMSTAQILQAACRYNATYLVADAAHPRDLPLAYQNDGFRIYQLPLDACPQPPAP